MPRQVVLLWQIWSAWNARGRSTWLEVWADIQVTVGRVMRLTKRGIDLRCSVAELVTIRKGELRDLTVAWLLHSAGLRLESTVNQLSP